MPRPTLWCLPLALALVACEPTEPTPTPEPTPPVDEPPPTGEPVPLSATPVLEHPVGDAVVTGVTVIDLFAGTDALGTGDYTIEVSAVTADGEALPIAALAGPADGMLEARAGYHNVLWDIRGTGRPHSGRGINVDTGEQCVVAHNLLGRVRDEYAVSVHLGQKGRIVGGRVGLCRQHNRQIR